MADQHAHLTEVELQQLLVWSERPVQLRLSALDPPPTTSPWKMMQHLDRLMQIADASRLAAANAVADAQLGAAGGGAAVPFNVRMQAVNSALFAFYDACVLHNYTLHFKAPLHVSNMRLSSKEPGLARAVRSVELAARAQEAFVQSEADMAAGAVTATVAQLAIVNLARRLAGVDSLPVRVVDN